MNSLMPSHWPSSLACLWFYLCLVGRGACLPKLRHWIYLGPEFKETESAHEGAGVKKSRKNLGIMLRFTCKVQEFHTLGFCAVNLHCIVSLVGVLGCAGWCSQELPSQSREVEAVGAHVP